MSPKSPPTDENPHTNLLAAEKSPYLLQHARNPVHWQPWGEAAFNRALEQDKPLFISIGYSTCHWCHVMERESFTDPAVAAVLNDHFVPIKVDREEHPEVDHHYMQVSQVINGMGGWPLNVFATPQRRAFFAVTYVPKTSRDGRVGLIELAEKIHRLWQEQRPRVLGSSAQILDIVDSLAGSGRKTALGRDLLESGFRRLRAAFDQEHGGFGKTRKFPTPHNLFFLLRYWRLSRDAEALQMVTQTLEAFRLGGLHDHVGGGFHRYTTDRRFHLPHFEKMLYDQALLTLAYLEAFQATADERFAATARHTLAYAADTLADPDGGFYTAQDADSEGEEGKFYVWHLRELKEVLGAETTPLFATLFNVLPTGNFQDERSGKRTGANVLRLSEPLAAIAERRSTALHTLTATVTEALSSLRRKRAERVPPAVDDKILTDMNGLMIGALARSARVLKDVSFLEQAQRTARFVWQHLRDEHGTLYHSYRHGRGPVKGLLSDYAFFLWGIVELLQAGGDARWRKRAAELTETMQARFWDPKTASFFITTPAENTVPLRGRETSDGAIPSSTAMAAHALFLLGRLNGRPALIDTARQALEGLSDRLAAMPDQHAFALCTVSEMLTGYKDVRIVGSLDDPRTEALRAVTAGHYLPELTVTIEPPDPAHAPAGHTPRALVCTAETCREPVTDPAALKALLEPTRIA